MDPLQPFHERWENVLRQNAFDQRQGIARIFFERVSLPSDCELVLHFRGIRLENGAEIRPNNLSEQTRVLRVIRLIGCYLLIEEQKRSTFRGVNEKQVEKRQTVAAYR